MARTTKKEDIEALKSAIEEAVGMKFITSGHFDQLRQFVFYRTGEYVSTTTLKRLWGYLNESLEPRVTTLSMLATTLGFQDWEDFLKRNESAPSEKRIASSPKFGSGINVATDLKEGDEIMLYWYPGRECLIKYLGSLRFEVLESQKTRLKPGDQFSTHLIIAGHPLYLSELIHKGMAPTAYICGKLHGGIQFRIVKSAEE